MSLTHFNDIRFVQVALFLAFVYTYGVFILQISFCSSAKFYHFSHSELFSSLFSSFTVLFCFHRFVHLHCSSFAAWKKQWVHHKHRFCLHRQFYLHLVTLLTPVSALSSPPLEEPAHTPVSSRIGPARPVRDPAVSRHRDPWTYLGAPARHTTPGGCSPGRVRTPSVREATWRLRCIDATDRLPILLPRLDSGPVANIIDLTGAAMFPCRPKRFGMVCSRRPGWGS